MKQHLKQSKNLQNGGIEEDGKTYGHFVDGIVTVVDRLLDKLKEENNGRLVEN